jgi:hypothetical protein
MWKRLEQLSLYVLPNKCSFAEASPKTKNPRRPPLHHFCQRSNLHQALKVQNDAINPGLRWP